MNSTVRAIIETVASEFAVPVERITAPCRSPRVVQARIEVTRRIKASCKYSSNQIAAILGHDHTTILFYLGRLQHKRPPHLKWHRPRIKHLHHRGCKHCYFGPPLPKRQPKAKAERPRRRRYPIPYAGNDFHRFKERQGHG